MKSIFKNIEQATIAAEAAKLIASKDDYEPFLSYLRERGFNKLNSMKALMEATGVSLGEAKGAVHLSKAWEDVRLRDERLHDATEDAAKQLGFDETHH